MITRTTLVAAVAALTLTACTSTPGGAQPGTETSPTPTTSTTSTASAVAATSAPQTSTHSAQATPVATTPAAAKALIASAEHVDANTYQTGSFSPNVPAKRMEDVVQFTTPSGNIRCTMASTLPSLIMCSIDSFDFTPPSRPADCHLNWASGLIHLHASGATLGQCVGGPEVTYLSRVLPYGRAIQALGIGCYSSSAALTCVDVDSGHGFTVSKAAFTRF